MHSSSPTGAGRGPDRRRPSLIDVARAAGVSHQTVSRVLNDHPRVAPETRTRVRAVMDDLGYRRNEAARSLVTRRTSIIGVITSGTTHGGPSGTLTAVERAAREAGYFVSVASLTGAEAGEVELALDHFSSQGVEGIVVIAPEAALAMASPFRTTAPVVLVAAGADAMPDVRIASVDQEGGARQATRHLLDLGHKRIAHIAGPEPWFDATARIRGWRSELAGAGVRPGPLLRGDWSARSGAAAAARLLRGSLPTAVFVANDLMAIGAIRAFHDAGLTVPQQVSVVGFDDIPGADYLVPGLTTVRQDLATLGARCVAMLLSTIAGESVEDEPVPTELVVRESTGAPPSTH